MKIPRFLAVFLCSAGALLALALLKAALVSGIHTLPSTKILIFAASSFGLVAAAIDRALLRDLLPPRRVSEQSYAPDPRLRHEVWRKQALELPPDPLSSSSSTAPHQTSGPLSEPGVSPAAAISRASTRPIVFKEICPPPAGGLSFYGGVPLAPAGFQWPRTRNKPDKVPLSFVMQWDCAELAVQDATGLIPRDGVLYLFCDLTWGEPFDFQFIHAAGPPEGWQALPVPADLPPLYGDEGVHLVPYCSPRVEKSMQDVPRLLPRWPFNPIAFSYPDTAATSETGGRFWNGGDAVGQALLAVDHPQGLPPAQPVPDKKPPFGRPFPAFPHDYAAVRIVAAELLTHLSRSHSSLLRERSEYDRKSTLQRWGDSAAALYTSAASNSPAARVEQAASDKIWRRIEEMAPALEQGWNSLVQQCVNTSLGIGSEASGVLPDNLVAECAHRHALASVYPGRQTGSEDLSVQSRTIHAPTPNHMFGPPSFVQGHVEEYLDDWVLLLELSSRKQIGHEFGEGVYQFLIRPVHLQERRFDRVKLVASAY